MWAVGEASPLKTFPFNVWGRKYIFQQCSSRESLNPYRQDSTNRMPTARGFSLWSLEKMNPRNVSHFMSSDLKRVAALCGALLLAGGMEWVRGQLQSGLCSTYSPEVSSSPQMWHFGKYFTIFFMCVLNCVRRWMES